MTQSLRELLGIPEIQAVLIRRFPAQDMLRYIGGFQDAFSQYLGGQVDLFPANQTTPPGQPRFGIKGPKKALQVSNVFAQLNLDFSGGPPKGGIVPALTRAAMEMDKLDGVLAHQSRSYSGIVVSTTFPVKPADIQAVVQGIANGVLADPPKPAASLSFAFSRESGDVFRNIEFSQVKSATFQQVAGQPLGIHLDFDFDANVSDGFEVKLDVNSRPRMNAPRAGDFTILLSEYRSLIKEDAPRYLSNVLDLEVYG